MSYQVLARKWRPRNFKEMAGQSHVLKTLINALDSKVKVSQVVVEFDNYVDSKLFVFLMGLAKWVSAGRRSFRAA